MKYFVAIVTMILALGAAAAENAVVSNAQSIARSWLALTDAGKYSESWDSAAVLFRAAMTKPDWEKALKSARSPLGALKGRTVKSATYARTLPGAPEGEYVVVQFESQFENKALAIETVTPMREKDGSWKVSGYFIK